MLSDCSKREATTTIRGDSTNRRAVPVAFNRDLVTAEVLAVRLKTRPQLELDLKILDVKQSKGVASFAKVGEVITASPNFKYGPGKNLDLSIPENRALIALDGVRVKDTINIELMYSGGEEGQSWKIEDFKLPEDK